MSKKESIRRSYIFQDYYSRLKNLALAVYKWENLPETCNERFLEDTLFHYGMAVFVEDSDMSFLNLKVTPAGELNVYNEPISYTAYSTGYTKVYSAEDCVPIWNNYLKKSTESTIILFAERLTEIEMALRVNINAQKTPILIRCDEKTRTSLNAVYDQYVGDKPVIFGTKSLEDKPLEALTTGAPFVADKLREEKRAVWNEFMEFIGINTNPADKKKERVIVSEIQANNEQTDIQNLTMYLCRQNACDEINKKYGLNVSVTIRVDLMRDLYDYNHLFDLHLDDPKIVNEVEKEITHDG